MHINTQSANIKIALNKIFSGNKLPFLPNDLSSDVTMRNKILSVTFRKQSVPTYLPSERLLQLVS